MNRDVVFRRSLFHGLESILRKNSVATVTSVSADHYSASALLVTLMHNTVKRHRLFMDSTEVADWTLEQAESVSRVFISD